MTDLFPEDAKRAGAIKELKRELKMRQRVYPRWVADGRMTKAAADDQIYHLMNAIDMLEGYD